MKLFFGAGNQKPIHDATDVRNYLPASKMYQYADGRSMAEAAKSWVCADGFLPPTIAAVVGGRELESAHFEFPTPVWGGGIAMTDVMAFIPKGVIAVEAKVDEPFDRPVSKWIEANGQRNKLSPPHRKKVIARYAEALGVAHEQLDNIGYQL